MIPKLSSLYLPALLLLGCTSVESPSSLSRICPEARQVDLAANSDDRRLDLLLVIDNSRSMTTQQEALRSFIAELVPSVAESWKDLHLGVISGDLGAGDFHSLACSVSGDGGALRASADCAPAAESGGTNVRGSFLQFRATGETPASTFAAQTQCITDAAGSSGCGFQQPLEAALMALTPSSAATVFGTSELPGLGDGQNQGFLRQPSTLAIVLVSDADDCSTAEPTLFDPMDASFQGDLTERCLANPDSLLALERFTNGLLTLRPDPRDLYFTAIAGVPIDLAEAEFNAVLADPRMQLIRNPGDEGGFASSCTSSRGNAAPPRRLIGVANALDRAGVRSSAHSICAEDLSMVAVSIARELESINPLTKPPFCFRQDTLRVGSSGQVNCEIHEHLAATGSIAGCSELAGQGRDATPVGTTNEGAEVCRIRQTEVWHLNDDDTHFLCGQQIDFSPEFVSTPGAALTVHCFQPDTPAGELFRVPGDSCQATNGGLHDEICSCTGLYAEECSVDSLLQDTMICHPTTQRCEVPCTIDSDCPATEMVCDDDLSICTHPICEA